MQDYLSNLRDARQRAWSEARELVERAERENREFTAEEHGKWAAINADIDSKDEQIRSFIEIEHLSLIHI